MKKTLTLFTFFLLFASCSSSDKTIMEQQYWLHRANSIEKAQHFQYEYAGLEIDVRYNDSLNTFFIKHDDNESTALRLEEWCSSLENVSTLGIWFDFKNLDIYNGESAVHCLEAIRDEYHLRGSLIVEASAFNELRLFRQAGFLDSFYIPYFNPSTADSITYQKHVETIQSAINCGVTFISGYDFQYDFMEKEFPKQDKLLWTVNTDPKYHSQLKDKTRNDPTVKVILFPNDNY